MNNQMVMFGTARVEDVADIDTVGLMVEAIRLKKPKWPSIFANSPFKGILTYGSVLRGKVGELYVIMLARLMGFSSDRYKGAGQKWDIQVEGTIVEVKLARLKEEGGYIVNQIRDQEYEYLCVVMMLPKSIEIFTVPKEVAFLYSQGQHGGNEAKETRIWNITDLDEMRTKCGQYEGNEYFKSLFKGATQGKNMDVKCEM